MNTSIPKRFSIEAWGSGFEITPEVRREQNLHAFAGAIQRAPWLAPATQAAISEAIPPMGAMVADPLPRHIAHVGHALAVCGLEPDIDVRILAAYVAASEPQLTGEDVATIIAKCADAHLTGDRARQFADAVTAYAAAAATDAAPPDLAAALAASLARRRPNHG